MNSLFSCVDLFPPKIQIFQKSFWFVELRIDQSTFFLFFCESQDTKMRHNSNPVKTCLSSTIGTERLTMHSGFSFRQKKSPNNFLIFYFISLRMLLTREIKTAASDRYLLACSGIQCRKNAIKNSGACEKCLWMLHYYTNN